MLKIVTRLPPEKYYQQIAPTQAWHRWEDKSSPRVRILSKIENPWSLAEILLFPSFAFSKADNSEFPVKLDFKIFEVAEQSPRRRLIREKIKGMVIHTTEPCDFFAAVCIPSEGTQLWLAYSIV